MRFTDISSVVANLKLEKQLTNLKIVSASIKRQLTTPLKCVAAIAEDKLKIDGQDHRSFLIVRNTANMCLSYVEGKMDQLFLQNPDFQVRYQECLVFRDVV